MSSWAVTTVMEQEWEIWRQVPALCAMSQWRCEPRVWPGGCRKKKWLTPQGLL